jgi:hypothetical protein
MVEISAVLTIGASVREVRAAAEAAAATEAALLSSDGSDKWCRLIIVGPVGRLVG